jgi:hypothetical protein
MAGICAEPGCRDRSQPVPLIGTPQLEMRSTAHQFLVVFAHHARRRERHEPAQIAS